MYPCQWQAARIVGGRQDLAPDCQALILLIVCHLSSQCWNIYTACFITETLATLDPEQAIAYLRLQLQMAQLDIQRLEQQAVRTNKP